ncbi:hypothetical protein TCAL_06208 [Tigriopus californicus]|uniref:Uncharacterized protein n=1 Tax=Tigriopus californicus TaxID=6832 RepID=A0A553NSH9_TIGCA|nr:retinol dehydrogenase 12-like [Tigriopus californicus]TRY68392.1 hypothetical protein TCAL_06208 [Tigriopus californicus]|eukprot:TCALIF_06208-PA protein Name:"Similar to WWOX WW domain-containing oxidoreductase (Gallus gallus)" AED:0.04 eAED:0.04 QI:0/-1/0/1/-1/1/1/0/336
MSVHDGSAWFYPALWAGIAMTSLFGLRKFRSSKWGYFKIDQDLQGRVIVVTGANTGLGYHVCLQLAKAKATVILACRSETKGSEALRRIRSATRNEDLHFMPLDLANLESVQKFAQELQAQFPKIDCLVCNAGVWFPMEQGCRTQDGYEIHFGVNHLGHYLLARSLMENLKQSEDGRVVMVSSALMNRGQLDCSNRKIIYEGRVLDPTERKKYDSPGYNDSKLMNSLFAKALAQIVPDRVGVYSVSPGWCYTDLFRGGSWLKKLLILPFAFLFMRSASRGAQNIVHAVVEDKGQLTNGAYYADCQLALKENKKLDAMASEGQELWRLSDDLIRSYL